MMNMGGCKRNLSLKKKAPIFRNGSTPLHDAVFQGDIAAIKKHKKLIFEKNDLGQTALHAAMILRCRQTQIFQVLMYIVKKRCSYIERMRFINIPDKKGLTALTLAISQGYVEIAEELIDEATDFAIIDKDNHTALHKILLTPKITADKKRKLVQKLLADITNAKKYEEIYGPAYNAIRYRFLNQLGNRKNSRIKDTALHIAIRKGYADIVKQLLEAGALYNINEIMEFITYNKNFTISHYFLSNRIIAWEHLISPNLWTKRKTEICCFCEDHGHAIDKLLSCLHATLDVIDMSGHNLLHKSVIGGNHTLLQHIIQFDTGENKLFEALVQKNKPYYDLNGYLCNRQESPLDLLCNDRFVYKNRALIKVLLETKNIKTKQTVLEQAVKAKRTDIVTKIEKIKAVYCSKNKNE